MTRLTLRTLDGPILEGPDGQLAIGDPIGLGLACLAALSPDGVVEEAEALLRLTPDLTPADGRARVGRAIASFNEAVRATVLDHRDGRYVIDRTLIQADVEWAPVDGASGGDRFLTGFNLPDTPEYLEWIRATRPRIRPAAGVAPAKARGPRPWASIAIGLIGLIGLVAVYATRNTPPKGFDRGDAIVLADLENTTGDTLFDRSLITAAAIGLRQSHHLSLLPQSRTGAALQRMGVTWSDSLRFTLDLAREVAIRENVEFAVGFRLDPAGSGYRLSVEVASGRTGDAILATAANAETKAGTIAALDRLLQEVRAALGERRDEIRENSVALPAATTASLEALRSYATGSAAWSRGYYRIASELWHRALDLDTGFAMAMGALGAYAYYHHDRQTGERFYTEALRRSGRLTEWEQLELARSFASARQWTDSALALHRLMVERFSSSVTWYNYGTGLMAAGRPAEAIEALRRAADLDSSFANIRINLATASKALHRTDDALRYYEEAGALDSTILTAGNIGSEYGATLVAAGRPAEAAAVFQRMLRRNNLFDRSLGYRGLGYLGFWQGRFEEGVGAFRQATAVSRQQARSKLSVLRGDLLESLSLLLLGDSAEANRALDRTLTAVDSTIEPGFLALVGYGLARAGRPADLERLARSLRAVADTNARSDRSAIQFIEAELLLIRGQPDSAAAQFAQGRGPLSELGAQRRLSALAAAARVEPARRLADSLLAVPVFGSESQFEWLWNLALAAELEARAGRIDQARARYRRLLEVWADGDSASAPLAVARRRLEELSRSR